MFYAIREHLVVPPRWEPEQITFPLDDAHVNIALNRARSGLPQPPRLRAADEQIEYTHAVPVSLGQPRVHVRPNGSLRIDVQHLCRPGTPRIIARDAQQLLELGTDLLHDDLVPGIGRDVDVSKVIVVPPDPQLSMSHSKQKS